ncbi:MAG: C-terminal target protein [Flavipsychrobacter sp.]|nr:C-terminal target protein [Flavipsychrobacter sp.]
MTCNFITAKKLYHMSLNVPTFILKINYFMFNKKLMCVAALSASMVLPAQNLFARNGKSYAVSAYSIYQSLPVNTKAAEKYIKTINSTFPGWAVTTDKLNGMFTDIYGAPITADGNTISEKAQICISQQLGQSGINSAEWKLISTPSGRKTDYVNFTQTINGHNVVYSWLSFAFTKGGNLARIQMNNHGTPASNATAKLSSDEAKKAALQDLTDVAIEKTTIDANWEWYPIPTATGYTLHAAWHFEVEGTAEGSVPLDLTGYIDATSGAILERANETKETSLPYDVIVKGMVYKNNTLSPATLEPLTDLNLFINGDTIASYTDADGFYSSNLYNLPSITSIPLAGKWSTVIDSVTATIPVFLDTVLLPGSTFIYPVTAPSSDRHVNAYYHVNRVHSFMKDHFPLFTGMDFSLPTSVDLTTGSCNAFYNKGKINFYKESSSCNSFAEIGDIIYHEYGHAISDKFYAAITGKGMRNGSLNEACSDIWAMSITHDPILGVNAFKGYSGFIRRYDMMPQIYPVDLETNTTYADVHKNGQIIAGCWWDVAMNIGSIDTMAQLFTDVYFATPDGATGKEGTIYQTILIDALQSDDDNGNLLDGTPHYKQIVAAFAKHGIYLCGDMTLTHSELTNQPPFTPIDVTATLTMSKTSSFHDITLYYRTNGAGTWNAVAMKSSSTTVTATIPAQSMGTVVEYYFIAHDSLNNDPIAYFPVTYNTSLPANQITIPYQFGVGIRSVEGHDFESVVSGWLVGGNKGDDASTPWHQGPPIKNSHSATFPTKDHTSGTGKCLITGNGSSGTYGSGVADGTTTVLSPIFDINRFNIPVVEYYRWFSNEQGYENFKNDPWIVKVRNSASASWTTVENTYQADNNWRRRIFRVSSFLPSGSGQLQMMYVISDSAVANWADGGQSVTVGGIDDFFIYDMANTLEIPAVPATKAEVYPNPADDKIQIVLQAGSTGTASLYDMLGRKVAELSIDQNNTSYSINTKDLGAGQYNMVIQTNSSVQSKKVVVIHN